MDRKEKRREADKNSQPGPPVGETHRYTQILIDTTGVKGSVVSSATGNATLTRTGFDMANFVQEANVMVVSSNFFNVTGVAATHKRRVRH